MFTVMKEQQIYADCDLSLSQCIPEYSGHTRLCKVVKHKPIINFKNTNFTMIVLNHQKLLSFSKHPFSYWLVDCQANRKSGTL